MTVDYDMPYLEAQLGHVILLLRLKKKGFGIDIMKDMTSRQIIDTMHAWLSFHGLTTNNASFDLGDSLFGSLDQGKLSL